MYKLLLLGLHTKFLCGFLKEKKTNKKKILHTGSRHTDYSQLIKLHLQSLVCHNNLCGMPTLQKLLNYKDMNSTGGKMYFNKSLSMWNITEVAKQQQQLKAESTCAPASMLPWQLIPAMVWKDQEWQSWVRWKVCSASHTFTSFYLLSKNLFCSTNTSPFFGAFCKSVLYWWHRFTTMNEIIHRAHGFFTQHCLGQDLKRQQSRRLHVI